MSQKYECDSNNPRLKMLWNKKKIQPKARCDITEKFLPIPNKLAILSREQWCEYWNSVSESQNDL